MINQWYELESSTTFPNNSCKTSNEIFILKAIRILSKPQLLFYHKLYLPKQNKLDIMLLSQKMKAFLDE